MPSSPSTASIFFPSIESFILLTCKFTNLTTLLHAYIKKTINSQHFQNSLNYLKPNLLLTGDTVFKFSLSLKVSDLKNSFLLCSSCNTIFTHPAIVSSALSIPKSNLISICSSTCLFFSRHSDSFGVALLKTQHKLPNYFPKYFFFS